MKQLHYIIVLVTLLFVMSCEDLLTDIDIDGDDTVDSKNKAVAIIGSHMVNDKAVEIIKDDLLIEGNSVRDALLTKDAQGEWKTSITEDGITFIFIPSKDIPADSTGFPQKDLVAGTEYPIVISHAETESGISISDSDILGDTFINAGGSGSGSGTGGSGSGTGGSGTIVAGPPKTKSELQALIAERIKRDGNNANLNDINVRNITDMSSLFQNSSFTGDISAWDVSSVTSMSFMFNNSPFNQDISAWDVSNVTSMRYMFADSPFNQDISQWDVSSVKNMEYMFALTSQFNGDISQWDVSKVTNMLNMFYEAQFNQDISQWDVSNVTTMEYMFAYASRFNGNISKWDVSSVTNMSKMFYDAKKMTYNLDAWGIQLRIDISKSHAWTGSGVERAGNLPSWA